MTRITNSKLEKCRFIILLTTAAFVTSVTALLSSIANPLPVNTPAFIVTKPFISPAFWRRWGGSDYHCWQEMSRNYFRQRAHGFFFQLKCSSLICNLPEVLQANSSEPSKQSRLPSHLYRPRTHLPLPTQRNCEGSHVASSVVARRRLNVTIKIINDTILRNVEKITRVNCKNLRQPCSSLRSPQSSSKSQTNSEETHRSFLQCSCSCSGEISDCTGLVCYMYVQRLA